MSALLRALLRWRIGPVLLLVGSVVFGGLAAQVGHDTARVVRDVDPDAVVTMRVERIVEVSRWPREVRALGWLPDEPSMKSVRVDDKDGPELRRTGGTLGVVATGTLDEPYVTKRWYDDQPFVRLGEVVLPWHYIVTVAFAAFIYWIVAHRRHELLRPTPAAEPFDLHPAMLRVEPRYAPMVERLEREAAADPASYRRRVIAYAGIGYLFLGAIFVAAAATTVVGVWLAIAARAGVLIKLVFPLVALAGIVLRALWVSVPPVKGRVLSRAEAPALFAMLDRLRASLRGPRLHDVRVVEAFNAAIVQRPRLGVFGWPRNTLIIGLPLLLGLPPAEFEAVIAHEYGHLAGAHGRLAAWVYRVRRTWSRLAIDLARRARWGAIVFRRFFDWYAPWFNAYSFVLARANEFAADRLAAAATSPRVVADALARVAILDRHVDATLWPEIGASARLAAEPPYAFRSIAAALRTGVAPIPARQHLDAALARRTGLDDTHPSIGDRIGALGQSARVPESSVRSAAEALLGDRLPLLLQEFDDAWRRGVAASWEAAHAAAVAEKAELEALEAAALGGPLDPQQAWTRAVLTERVLGGPAALPLLEALITDSPRHAPALFARGRLRLSNADDAGLADLDAAMALDPEAVIPGCELAYGFLMARGRAREAEPFRVRGAAAYAERDEAAAERAGLDGRSAFAAHGLAADALEAVRSVLAAEPALRRAWLVRKVVRHRPEMPVFVVVARFAWFSRRRRPRLAGEVADALARLDIAGSFWVLPADLLNWRLVRRARRAAGGALVGR
ncbi:MAG: M48 family metallopeptidase [Alphaproteobacteria bacterium]|nr:M48 family metallopeptidase [Alphaproteobacteria bacterium]